jgi:hypothetical protein
MRTRKQLFVAVTLAVFILTLVCPSARTLNSRALAQQQDESTATLAETLSFIKGKINAYQPSIDPKRDTDIYKFESSNGCNVTLSEYHYYEGSSNGGRHAYYTYTFSLHDLDPLSVKISVEAPELHFIKMETTDSKELVQIKEVEIDSDQSVHPGYEAKGKTLYLSVSGDHEIAVRLVMAFKHAIKLCGGKVDPF